MTQFTILALMKWAVCFAQFYSYFSSSSMNFDCNSYENFNLKLNFYYDLKDA